ncbi:LysM peptidoglycan-binding domain-containing protein [Gorillibacterium sp. sgz5001074]|uniref:LysM peptidoglycan-binding domain-containing protein n=1 Tax=Gorillibacterium sp. sgz5001074 TaxID=3446695 RepID=UPI003F680051
MAERQTGLRFDIYERVHLADNTVGVQELDEIELVPHIAVYTEGEQAYLKGNLYLTGSYVGDSGGEQRTLEHLIPVEITLPLNRIQDVNQVSVDIDNFDVDLLSPRSLNVTGVLTLHGIEMLPVPDESWREEEETVIVAKASQFGDISTFGRGSVEQEPESAPSAAEPAQPEALLELRSAEEEAEPEPAAQEEPIAAAVAEQPVRSEAAEEPVGETEVYFQPDDMDEINEEPEAKLPEAQADEVHEVLPEPHAAEEEKKELKIAFSSKPSNDPSYHLKSLIHNGESRSTAAPAAAEQDLAPTPRTDALEWKRLFVRAEAEDQKFSRVRVYIVQKEDTAESIAGRYNLNPREILLYNRVTEQELAEGKALFIPR